MDMPDRHRNRLALEPRQLISLAIVILTLFVIGLAGLMAWHLSLDYRGTRQMVHANTMADHLIDAAAALAMERGLTATVLAVGKPATPDLRRQLEDLRRQAEAAWTRAQASARDIRATAPTAPALADQLGSAVRAHEALLPQRAAVDHCLSQATRCQLSGPQWIDTITAFIQAIGRLREDIFLVVDSRHGVVQFNLTMKRWAAVASENAGRERGILAWYIGARLPLPAPVLDELKNYRGVVDRTTGEMLAYGRRPHTDPRLATAIGTMAEVFLGEYEAIRQAVYAAAASGDYPLEADAWVREATRAIDTLHGISTAVSGITRERAGEIREAQVRQMLLHLLLILAALGMAGLGLTKVRQTANEMFRQKEMAEITLHSIGDAVVTTDAGARVEYLNPVAEELTGWSSAEAHGRELREVFQIINGLSREPQANPVEDCLRERRVVGLAGNTILVRRDGTEFVVEDSAAPILDRDGGVAGAVMVFYDVSLMRRVPHLLSYHATHDALTGLINRREFERHLAELLVQARRTGQQHALAYLDLDQFKLVNDTCGHGVGDRLLCQITYLLKEKIRESDILARLGGDEFGLLLENCTLERGSEIADHLRQTIKDFRFVYDNHSFDIGISIGLVPISADSVNAAEVLSEADAACFVAKEKGRNRIQIHQPGDVEMARRHGEMQWVSRLHRALEEDRFRLYCQTIAPLNGDLALHGEVLLRLEDENGEIVPPLAFLPAAERYNLMPAIDRWVIRNALAAIATWLAENPGEPRPMCNINLSGASLGEEGLEAYIAEQLALHGMPAEAVCFEITESVAIANLERAAGLIHALRKRGCRFALDDFGSGLSSFAYLKTLPVDYLKIDGIFIKEVAQDPVARAMVQAIHTVGHVMGIRTVAEYVENDAILEVIREIGLDYAQGYAIGRPKPMSECLRRCGRKEGPRRC